MSQSCPEISINQLNINTPIVETFSENQRGINVSQTKEDLSIETNIKTSLLGTARHIHPKIYAPLPAHTGSNSTKPYRSKISKIEAQLIALKSYVKYETSPLHSKIESTSQRLQVTLKVFQERENKTNEIFLRNTTFSQNELLTKNEIIKSLNETETAILEELSSFKSNQQYEGNQTNLLTCQKQHQF